MRANGNGLYRLVCEQDLEGIVGKWTDGTYQNGPRTSWLKIKNPDYTQMEGRAELFEKRSSGEGRRVKLAPPELCLRSERSEGDSSPAGFEPALPA